MTSTVGKVFSTQELETFSRERLNEDPERREADVKAIKHWMSKQPHLKGHCRTDDAFILMFLRGCKFSLERTKEKLDTWHTVRTLSPDIFQQWDPLERVCHELITLGINVPLKGYDKLGRKVVIMRGSKSDPDKHSLLDQFRASMLINEYLMKDCADIQGQVCGVVIIQDVLGTKLGHIKQFSPSFGKKLMTIFQEAYPSNPKSMHFLGMPAFMESVFSVMMSFAKDKLRQRIQVHAKGNDFDLLHKDVGPEVLPKEYGGTNGTIQDHIDQLKAELVTNRSWLIDQYKYRSNEKKRPGKEKLYSDVFGMEGSFRQLTVD